MSIELLERADAFQPHLTSPSLREAEGDEAIQLAGTANPDLKSEQWQRLHFLTPALHAWQLFAAGFAIFLYVGVEILSNLMGGDDAELLPGAEAIAPTLSEIASQFWWVAVLAVAVLVGVIIGFMILAWKKMAFQLDDNSVRFRSGIIFRKVRDTRIDRIQSVEIRQPLFARLGGLAELTVESAGGPGSQIKIGFLKLAEAQALRAEILARAAGVRSNSATSVSASSGAPEPRAEQVPSQNLSNTVIGDSDPQSQSLVTLNSATSALETPETPVFEVPASRILAAVALSGATIWTLVVAIAAVVLSVIFGWIVMLSLVPLLFGLAPVVFSMFSSGYGFRAAISADGIRVRSGLLETRTTTVPPGRVQSVHVYQPLLWRPLGWWRVRITVAGWYGEEANTQQHRNILLPVGTREDAWKALWLVLPELGLDDPTDLLDEAMFGNHKSARWFTPAPTRSWIFSPFQWRRRGFTHTSKVLVTRGGWLVRYFDVVPHERAQSLCVQQGPLQRLANLASVKAHVSTAYFHPMAKHMKVEDAEALVENETNLAAAARAVQTPEQWLAAVSA